MAVKYLKKKKMFELLKSMEPLSESVKLSDCTYKFHGGVEWLTVSVDHDHVMELCLNHGGDYLSYTYYLVDWNNGCRRLRQLDRHIYYDYCKMEVAVC